MTKRLASSRQRTPPPSDPTKRPKRPPGSHWSDGLVNAMRDPEQIFEQDHLSVTLKDGFPKAKYHYLIVPREKLNSVTELTSRDLHLLQHLHKVAENLVLRIQSKEPDLKFRFGYHAVPSMHRMHMHVVSQDFSSPRMRTKHHWNTFNTDYFIDSAKLINTLEKSGRIEVDVFFYEQLLNLPMKCNQCSEVFEDVDLLKSHLAKHLHQHNTGAT